MPTIAHPSIDPTPQQDDDDDDVRDVRDEVRHATIKNYFLSRPVSQQTSRDARGVGRDVRRWHGDGSTMERTFGVLLDCADAQSDRTSRRPRSSNPARRRLVVSPRGNNSPRFNRRRLDVDRASPTPGPGTLWTDSLLILLRFFPRRSSVAARSTYGQGTSDAHIGTLCVRQKKRIMAHRVRFRRARSRVARRPDGGYRRRTTSGGWARRRPLSMLDGGVGYD